MWNLDAYTDKAGFYFPFDLFPYLFVVKQQMNALLDRQVFHVPFRSFQGSFMRYKSPVP